MNYWHRLWQGCFDRPEVMASNLWLKGLMANEHIMRKSDGWETLVLTDCAATEVCEYEWRQVIGNMEEVLWTLKKQAD